MEANKNGSGYQNEKADRKKDWLVNAEGSEQADRLRVRKYEADKGVNRNGAPVCASGTEPSDRTCA